MGIRVYGFKGVMGIECYLGWPKPKVAVIIGVKAHAKQTLNPRDDMGNPKPEMLSPKP